MCATSLQWKTRFLFHQCSSIFIQSIKDTVSDAGSVVGRRGETSLKGTFGA